GRDVPALPADVSGSDSVHAWFGEADTVISLSRTGDVRASDATTGRILWSRFIGVDGAPGDADFAAARVAVSTGNVARVFELPNATEVATVPLRGGGFRLSPDGRRLLTFVTAADDEGDGVPTIPVVDNMELWD